MRPWRDHLDSNPQILGGQLCAKGTRDHVTVILDSLAEGATQEQILTSYPTLRPEHIDAYPPSWLLLPSSPKKKC